MVRDVNHLADRGIRNSIAQRLALLTPSNRPHWGRMSSHEAICHLSDSFRLPLERKTASDATGFLQRTLVKWVALHAPITWPKGVATRPEMQQRVGGTPPVDFARDRADLVWLMEEFVNVPEFKAAHPIFGRLTTEEWMRWGFLHADHHLRQFDV